MEKKKKTKGNMWEPEEINLLPKSIEIQEKEKLMTELATILYQLSMKKQLKENYGRQ